MKITSTTTLDHEQKTAVLALQTRVHEADGTFKDVYLSNQFNTEPTMDAFFLAEEGAELVGFLMIYADEGPEEEADFSIVVAPNCRRQGIATQLLQAAQAELARFGYHNYSFVTERIFLDANPDFTKNWGLVEDPETEFQLAAPAGTNAAYKLPAPYQLRFLKEEDVAELATASVEAFGDSREVAERYLRQPLTDPASNQYVLIGENAEILASVAVDLPGYYFFFSLFVQKKYRHQGIGTMLIRAIMAEVSRLKPKPFALAVEADNAIAHRLYVHAGMHDQTEVIYLNVIKK